MIDVHSHLLPFLDDGASDWEEAMQMAKQAVADGIRLVIATPHHANGHFENPAGSVIQAVDELNSRIQQAGLDLVVLPGQEVRVYDNLLGDLEAGQLLALNQSKYLLLELPFSRVPDCLEELIYELSLLDIQPVIAHPERNSAIAENPMILQKLVELGALAQLTAQSVTGAYGRKLQKVCFHLCRMNLVHLVATDAHDTEKRPFSLAGAYLILEQELGIGMARYLQDNARKIVTNLPISSMEVTTPVNTEKGITRFFRGLPLHRRGE
jgi:protein-tyrosine phosphatase